MKKKMIGRGVIGFPVGIAIGYVITVIISICIGDGFFHPVNPELVNKMGSELNAILIQTGLSGIMGTGFAMASVIWEIDSWSLAKQSGIYFSIACRQKVWRICENHIDLCINMVKQFQTITFV